MLALECATCGISLPTLAALIEHEVSVHQKDRGKFVCIDCGAEFSSKFELIRHSRIFCQVLHPAVREKRQEIEAERREEKREKIRKMRRRNKMKKPKPNPIAHTKPKELKTSREKPQGLL